MNLFSFLFKKKVRSIVAMLALSVLVTCSFGNVKADSSVPATIVLSVTDVTAGSISLSWTPVAGATGYNLYVSKYADHDFNKMNLTPITESSYSDKGLFSKESYFYKVTAVAADGESDISNVASAVTADGGTNAQNFDQFIKGAAMDFTNEVEQAGFVFKENGVPKDPFQSLADHGVNVVRYGVNVDPVYHAPWHGKEQTLNMAKRVESKGMMFFPDFTYSNCCADNSYQGVPPQWKGHTFEQLQQDVFNETYDVLKALKDQGTPPQMVQIGNELNGMLGVKDSDIASISAFLKAGVAAVKAVDPHIRIVIHHASSNLSGFYKGIVANGVDFDVIGISSYPVWGGTLNQLVNTAQALSGLHKYFMPVETAYGWSDTVNYDSVPNIHGVSQSTLDGYPATLDGQKNYLIEMMDVVARLPGGMGVGIEYWPTDTVSFAPYYESRNDNATFWYSDTGEVVPSMSAFEANVVRGIGVTTPFLHPIDFLVAPPATIPAKLNETFDETAIGSVPQDWTFVKSAFSTDVAVTEESSGGNRVLSLIDNSTKNSIEATKTFGAQLGKVRLAFKFKFSNAPKYEGININYDGGNAISFTTTTGKLTLIGNRLVGNSDKPIANLQAGTWYELQLDINVPTNTFDLTLDGNPVLTNAPFSRPAKFVDRLDFQTLGSGIQTMSLDDVQAETVDETPPVTKASVSGTMGQNNWYVSNAQATLTATDDLSGVAKTVYRLNDADWQTYNGPIVLDQDGMYTLHYRSTDVAGNVETEQSLTINRDATAPTYQLLANGNEWTPGQAFADSDSITLDLQAADNLSGVGSKAFLVDGQLYSNGTKLDFAGKTGTHTVTIKVTDVASNLTQADVSFMVETSIDSMRKLIDRYTKAGELGGPLVPQLTNRLDQAELQVQANRYDQAVKHIQDLLKSLKNEPLQSNISDNAKTVLNEDANSLIAQWHSQP